MAILFLFVLVRSLCFCFVFARSPARSLGSPSIPSIIRLVLRPLILRRRIRQRIEGVILASVNVRT